MVVQESQPTTTVTATSVSSPPSSGGNVSRTLRLRASPADTRHIQWAEDVVDNEGMGKKSSKVCCIYHKTREVGESSDEDSSDSSSSDGSDSEADNSRAQPRGQSLGRQRRRHSHDNDEPCQEQHSTPRGSESGERPQKQDKSKRRSPNAYEKMPKTATVKSDTS